MTLDIAHPGALSKAQRDPSLCTYVAALQREVENEPVLDNVIIPNSNKRNCIVLFGVLKPKEFPKL